MPLTHVCVWDGKAGYRRVSIEEACSMYPYTVSANSEIFVCSLCAQPVCLTAPGIQRRNFRHNSATQNKECEDRAQAYARASTGYNCHPMPLRIKVAHGSYLLELGFFHAPSSATSGPRCQTIIITDDNKQQHIYSFERLSAEGVTYLNVGNIPSTEYHLSYNHPSSNLDRYWPSKTTGVNIRGSFFDCSTWKILHSGSKAYPYRDYYLLQRRSIGHVPHGISYESIAETRTGSFTTWYLYKIHVQDFSASVARFFLERSIFLTEKPVAFYPIWPPYVENPYFLYHHNPRMYFYMQGGDAELNIYPDTIYAQHQNLGDGKLYRIYAASKEQLLSLGQSGAIGFSYLMTKPLDMVSAFPEVQIKNIDGKLISEVTCNQLPKGKQIIIQAPFDGKVILLKNDKILEIRHIAAEVILTVDDLSFGCEVRIFQSCDVIRNIKFEKPKNDTDTSALDRQLVEKLRSCKGVLMPVPHSIGAVVGKLTHFPLTKEWFCSKTKEGRISRTAYWILVTELKKCGDLR